MICRGFNAVCATGIPLSTVKMGACAVVTNLARYATRKSLRRGCMLKCARSNDTAAAEHPRIPGG
jgi:hypothetical protein